jgi:hypothetical protein
MIAARMRPLPASPLSLHRYVPERSSPSRDRFAAQNRRALDRSGPFRKLILDKGKGANAKSKPFSALQPLPPPVGRPPAINPC